MADVVDKQTRSRMMSGIKGKNTSPEIALRKGLHRRGFRFRLHRKDLPGNPDIVLPKYRTVILINGCFWHAHDCHLFKWPSTRPEFWREKIGGNMKRDRSNWQKLQSLGWRVLIVWECAVKGEKSSQLERVLDCVSEMISAEWGKSFTEIDNGSCRPD